jgi:hypothetical protein
MRDLAERLRHLVSLHRPEDGGPYAGYAAEMCMEAMREAASVIERYSSSSEAECIFCARGLRPDSFQTHVFDGRAFTCPSPSTPAPERDSGAVVVPRTRPDGGK